MYVRTRTWLGVVIVAALLFIAGSRFAMFDPLEGAALSVAEPVESGLSSATRPVADFVNNLTDVNRLSSENQTLREETERLTSEVARLREAERELQEFRQFEELRGVREGDAFVRASVFAREPNNSQDLIAIDRGSNDGLREGMIALTPQGTLVGTVEKVHGSSAWVKLITDPSSAVAATIQASRTEGVVAGSTDGTLTMEFVERTADVKEGDAVLTSGIGGSYPSGELIGQVVHVDQAAQELFKKVEVHPLADLSRLEHVIVLTSFLPREPGAP
jgi:rod shape-determining protein MreC